MTPAGNSIVFRADGGAAIGLGHIKRCEVLARGMQARGAHVAFMVQDEPFVTGYVAGAGFECRVLAPCADRAAMLDQTVADVRAARPSAVVLDVIESGAWHVRAMQSAGCVVAGLDDLGHGAEEFDAHFAVDETVVRAPLRGRLFAGPRYVIIPEQLKKYRPVPGADDEPQPVLCVGFGGSDMRGLTLPAARALAAWDADFEAHIVLGPCVADPGSVQDFCAADDRFTVHRDPLELFQIMAGASLAVCSVGQGMFELACLGVPSLVVSLSELHERMAGNFAATGCSEHLGPHHAFSGEDFVARCRDILGHAERWRAMRQAALRTVDGAGARRICDLIWELMGNI